jgi:hypothetical protein
MLASGPAQQVVASTPSAIAKSRAGLKVHVKGDDGLTCPQILAEARARSKEFTEVTQLLGRKGFKFSPRTRSLRVAFEAVTTAATLAPESTAASTAAAIGAREAFMESARADERSENQPLEARQEFAMARADHLNDLYRQKCAGSASSASAAAIATTVTGATSDRSKQASANCASLRQELDALQKEIEGTLASVSSIAQQKSMTKSRSKGLGGVLGGVAKSLIPGAGAISSAAGALQARNEVGRTMDRQMEIAKRSAELGSRYAELCQETLEQSK